MAAHTLITTVSRRSMLAGGTAALVLSPATALTAFPADGTGDARIALLAKQYRCVSVELVDCIAEAEQLHGPFAYEERPDYKGRYAALTTAEDRIVAALARTRPNTIWGLAVKMRAAHYFGDPVLDCNTRILIPALDDLDRMAGRV